MRPLPIALSCALAACSPPPSVENSANAASPAPGEPGGLPDDRRPLDETPAVEDGAQAAATVVERYYGLIESGDHAAALRLREDGAQMDARQFAESFARYAEVHAQVGAPGRVDAGAGQRYVTVPVQLYGRLADGSPFSERATVTLHRAADIPGATPEQRRWRIRSIDTLR